MPQSGKERLGFSDNIAKSQAIIVIKFFGVPNPALRLRALKRAYSSGRDRRKGA